MYNIILIGILLAFTSCITKPATGLKKSSPLLGFSAEWNDSKYDAANSAADVTYMNETEKEVIHILNLVRMDPVLFERTVVSHYPAYKGNPKMKNSSYFKSLSSTLRG